MDEKNYTHKMVMFDVNGKVRTALFTSESEAESVHSNILRSTFHGFTDAQGTYFNLNNIVQMNPVEVIEK